MEVWKDIPEYEGFYQASNLGRIKSLDREVKHWRGGVRMLKSKIISLNKNSKGYLQVSLNKNGVSKSKEVHQLIAMAFLNHKPNGLNLVVNHIDFDKSNNNTSNLEIISCRENTNKKHIQSTSKHVGVYLDKDSGKWASKITVNGKREFLGRFKCETKAHLAYQKRLKEII